MTTQAKDNFENGIFWELYKDLEGQFGNFLEFVPYLEGNENVYSFKLVNLILSIGGHVDSAFKEMARYSEFSGNEDCSEIVKLSKSRKIVPIRLPLNAFEKEYTLSKSKVMFKRLPTWEEISPFEPMSSDNYIPYWWKIYNSLKHDVSINIKEANLQNTCRALAGAFLLNVVHVPAILRLRKYRILKVGASSESLQGILITPTSQMVERYIKRKRKFEGSVSTPIFIYDYNQ